MVVITAGPISEFAKVHPPSASPLNDWFFKTKAANWSSFSEMKLTFNSVNNIGNDRFVFNVGGGNDILVVLIHFGIRTLYVRRVLTHNDYDALTKAGSLNTL